MFALLLMMSGCTAIEIKEVDCNVNQSWPSCRVVAEKLNGDKYVE